MLEGPEARVKTVTVLVDVTQKQAKAYRGGYKDKRNGTLYHNADCQTDRQVRTHGKLCAQRDLNMVHILYSTQSLIACVCKQRPISRQWCTWVCLPTQGLCGVQLAAGPKVQRAERQCQTVEVKQRSAQTCREAHVQMARPDLLLNTSRDKLLAASEPPQASPH